MQRLISRSHPDVLVDVKTAVYNEQHGVGVILLAGRGVADFIASVLAWGP